MLAETYPKNLVQWKETLSPSRLSSLLTTTSQQANLLEGFTASKSRKCLLETKPKKRNTWGIELSQVKTTHRRMFDLRSFCCSVTVEESNFERLSVILDERQKGYPLIVTSVKCCVCYHANYKELFL